MDRQTRIGLLMTAFLLCLCSPMVHALSRDSQRSNTLHWDASSLRPHLSQAFSSQPMTITGFSRNLTNYNPVTRGYGAIIQALLRPLIGSSEAQYMNLSFRFPFRGQVYSAVCELMDIRAENEASVGSRILINDFHDDCSFEDAQGNTLNDEAEDRLLQAVLGRTTDGVLCNSLFIPYSELAPASPPADATAQPQLPVHSMDSGVPSDASADTSATAE